MGDVDELVTAIGIAVATPGAQHLDELRHYLNRLSDLLFILARASEPRTALAAR